MVVKKIALVGLGKQNIEQHLPAVLASNMVELIAACDTDVSTLNNFAKIHKDVECYTCFHDLIKSTNRPDLIIAALPHEQYVQVIEISAQMGIHILKEKPFARTLDEGKQIHQTINGSNIKLMTTSQRRFDPIFSAGRAMIGAIGRIHHITASYKISGQRPNVGWRGSMESAGGGVLLDMGYHLIDLIMWYIDPLDSVYCKTSKRNNADYDTEDTATVEFTIGNEISGSLFVSCVSSEKGEFIEFLGERGSVILGKSSVKWVDSKYTVLEEIERTEGWRSAMVRQLNYFIDVIDEKTVHKFSAPEYHLNNHLKIIQACYESSKRNSLIKI
ncbi:MULTISPECIES: Gfo/Idh/MocA family protein [unclassified Dolichospermum]|uniref:Gfo/Idh/MocA family protein n=1 Tax=unclassified Dolichospermum TaxID=2622029 RepID=UPI001447C590|nr:MULTISPECIES: Gfo/Idh/MocA family oxidoreductase [unclassified Dolichospermum]